MLLAGRAAEELLYGTDGISSGAGGQSSSSDLALATRHLLRLLTELGLHGERSLRWRSIDERPADVVLIGELLQAAYQRVRERLAAHRPLLDAIAEHLLADSELLADELEALACRHGITVTGAARPVPLQ